MPSRTGTSCSSAPRAVRAAVAAPPSLSSPASGRGWSGARAQCATQSRHLCLCACSCEDRLPGRRLRGRRECGAWAIQRTRSLRCGPSWAGGECGATNAARATTEGCARREMGHRGRQLARSRRTGRSRGASGSACSWREDEPRRRRFDCGEGLGSATPAPSGHRVVKPRASPPSRPSTTQTTDSGEGCRKDGTGRT